MTKETLERAKELEQEISELRRRIETLDDIICHEKERSAKDEDSGEIKYATSRRIEGPKYVYPSGTVLVFKTFDVLELLKTERAGLNQRLIELEEEFREL